jgi:hypothetical protein
MCNLLAVIMATVIHDYAHPGLDNKYMVDSDSEVSRRFNQRAVLENHSVYECLEMLRTHEFNPFADAKFNKDSLLSLVIKLVSPLSFTACRCFEVVLLFGIERFPLRTHLQVLATDMADHFFLVSDFKSKVICTVLRLGCSKKRYATQVAALWRPSLLVLAGVTALCLSFYVDLEGEC